MHSTVLYTLEENEMSTTSQNLGVLTQLAGTLPLSIFHLIGKSPYFEPANDSARTHWAGSGPPSIIGTETTIEGTGVPLTVVHNEVQKR